MKFEIYERLGSTDVLVIRGDLSKEEIHTCAQEHKRIINRSKQLPIREKKIVSYLPDKIVNGEVIRTIVIKEKTHSFTEPNSERHIMGW